MTRTNLTIDHVSAGLTVLAGKLRAAGAVPIKDNKRREWHLEVDRNKVPEMWMIEFETKKGRGELRCDLGDKETEVSIYDEDFGGATDTAFMIPREDPNLIAKDARLIRKIASYDYSVPGDDESY